MQLKEKAEAYLRHCIDIFNSYPTEVGSFQIFLEEVNDFKEKKLEKSNMTHELCVTMKKVIVHEFGDNDVSILRNILFRLLLNEDGRFVFADSKCNLPEYTMYHQFLRSENHDPIICEKINDNRIGVDFSDFNPGVKELDLNSFRTSVPVDSFISFNNIDFPTTFSLKTNKGYIEICDDGSVKIPEELSLDEASKKFWKGVVEYAFSNSNSDYRINYKNEVISLNDNKEVSEVSDGYHTFKELYTIRMLYNAALFNEWYLKGLHQVHKSKRHYDGELCFNGEYFIVVAMLPQGLISNHYKLDHWELFVIPETEKSLFEYDGHNQADCNNRLEAFFKGE
jgi:hypothetical protein